MYRMCSVIAIRNLIILVPPFFRYVRTVTALNYNVSRHPKETGDSCFTRYTDHPEILTAYKLFVVSFHVHFCFIAEK
jgi:hypothetical protein